MVIFVDFVKRKFNSDAMNCNYKMLVILSLVKAEIRPCELSILLFALVQMSQTVLLGVEIVDGKTYGTDVMIIVGDVDGNLVEASIVVAEDDR